MIENFSEYWESKKEILEKLGVTRDVAKIIWGDCADVIMQKIMAYYATR